MVRKLIEAALESPLLVILASLGLAGFGVYSFIRVNVEAYPDPAPAIIEVVAQYPGQNADQVEQQVTIPLEKNLAGMPGLKVMRTKSLFGLSHMRNQFEYGIDYDKARQEVINRLQTAQQEIPQGVTPVISPETPTGEIYRYTLKTPKDKAGQEIYTLNDIKALQDWVLEREFRRIPRIADVTSSGGTIRRYEIHPDPDLLRQKGITLQQVQDALSNSNANAGGGYLNKGHMVYNVRCIGLIGGGKDPVLKVLGMKDPAEAARILRQEEARRCRQIRQLVITSVNNVPVKIDDIVEGGPILNKPGALADEEGVVVGHQTRLGRVGLSRPMEEKTGSEIVRTVDKNGKVVWRDEDEKIQSVVLLRKGEDSKPALEAIEKRVKELNESGRLLPGVTIEPYYDRTDLINVTTETVQENLLFGMMLVTVILLMFLSNIRSAVIVAINIPLALLVAFSVLYLRGKSANLLSIGAVDFGIIVDSSVIMVENIYRHISAGEHLELPLKERILRACREVERGLFFSTAIMVCAFIPLFTMEGPEGQIFGPMAETYAFALGGALVLALTLAPVLCLLSFKNLKSSHDNFLVRWLKTSYLSQLKMALKYRWVTLLLFTSIMIVTGVYVVPRLGNEFMPELEEGNLWIRGTFPLNVSMDRVAEDAKKAREIIRGYQEVESIVPVIGRPDDGTDATGFYNLEIFVPLRPLRNWEANIDQTGWRRLFGTKRARAKEELVQQMNAELSRKLPGVDWNFSQNIRDNVMESLSGVKGDNSVKIFGPEISKLEELAAKVKNRLIWKGDDYHGPDPGVKGIENVGVFNIMGQSNFEFLIDPGKCDRWGVKVADVINVVQSALGGKSLTSMIEGEKLFDISVRWPGWRRDSETTILEIPVDISNNQVIQAANAANTIAAIGSSVASPSIVGSVITTSNPISNTPRVPLKELISPVGEFGEPDPYGSYEKPGVSTIYREQGNRFIAIKFSVRNRDLASAVAEAQEKTKDLFEGGYYAEWSGEFQEMESAEKRLMVIIPLSLGLIFALLYFAFRSLIDAILVLSNVVALSLGGVWALYLTDTNFSISAAVGFISIFGVAIMDGLLSVAYFNQLRAKGLPLDEAIMQGAGKRVRPMMMTALTAIFGLLPAALSTRIGAQTQRPLAIVVVGGMIMTLLLNRYLMPVLYSFYGHREPPVGAGNMAH
jgi:cobalt-zinc-cadmium resistance protein CzcA